MFRLFKSEPFRDGQLGEFRRSHGYWKGSLALPPVGTFSLSLAGSRQAPDRFALELAKELLERFRTLIPKIQKGLFEHYMPYRQAVDGGEATGSPCPDIALPEAVWPHVTPAHVLIEPLDSILMVQIAFRAAWDVEHTLGARFRDWDLIELNGSVRPL